MSSICKSSDRRSANVTVRKQQLATVNDTATFGTLPVSANNRRWFFADAEKTDDGPISEYSESTCQYQVFESC
ncbi:hypothetical protein L596_000338 [Steinernema carpocapsae]|uniref:Uncharacterized protein n=1 Tax=Steinernema carpocapsae TaxID=34508 RepID=A0A4U8UM21_STECR|nr:hypothetical protein L596_000338 [Steinernema carpocapsae]